MAKFFFYIICFLFYFFYLISSVPFPVTVRIPFLVCAVELSVLLRPGLCKHVKVVKIVLISQGLNRDQCFEIAVKLTVLVSVYFLR